MDNPVIILGANYLGRAAKEIFELNGNVVYGFLDDNKVLHGTEIDTIQVLGSTDDDGFLKLIGKKSEAFVATDDNKVRRSLVKMLNDIRHIQPVNAVHKSAILAKSSAIGHGNFIDMGATVGAGASIGNHCIINAGVVIGPEASLGDFVQVGIGSLVSAGVMIEEEVFIGSGATLIGSITIGKGARIGAGSVVISSIKAGETVFGNPAQSIKS